MSSYRRDFEARLPAINVAIDAMPGRLDQLVPSMSKAKLKRFYQRFGLLLGRLDKNGAKQPHYLFYRGQTLPDYLTIVVDQSTTYMASGASTFTQNSLTALVDLQDRLERAVGTDVDQLKGLASSVAADLSASVQQSDELLQRTRDQAEDIGIILERVTAQEAATSSASKAASESAARVEEVRSGVEQLVNPDGRSKSSLEGLARRARERIADVEKTASQVSEKAESAASELTETIRSKAEAQTVVQDLHALREEAQQILQLSSQAGLAASYKIESERLSKLSLRFTAGLYVASLLTAALAAFWVIPGLQKAIEANTTTSVSQGVSLALLRISALAPLIYLIYFTIKRVSGLETLRMDYAEKAAASLAYSGYREQMTSDDDLLRQLKGSLLIKFAEHPERLLRPSATSTSAKIKTAGFEAETSVNSPSGSDSDTKAI